MKEQNVIVLRAKPVKLRESDDYDSPHDQAFEFWDGSDCTWMPWHAKDFENTIREGLASEVQLQPLRMSDENFEMIKKMLDAGATGTSLYRQFWYNRVLKWELDQERRICWKLDSTNEAVYTTFDKGQWDGDEDDFHFKSDGKTNDFSGVCLSGLKFSITDVERWLGGTTLPSRLEYTACHCCVFDGIQQLTSFRGAHLHQATFCGESTLFDCDLSSSNCCGVTFSYPEFKTSEMNRIFRSVFLKGAWMEQINFDFMETEETQYPSESKAIYGLVGCCGGQEKSRCRCGFGIELFFGLKNFIYFLFFAIMRARETVLKHKQEIQDLLDELDRLRSYEVSKDNWQEIIDSWLAIRSLPLETTRAAEMRYYLFEDDLTRSSSHELLLIGNLLYSMDDEAPYGLILQIKRLIGEKLLRNKAFMERKKQLMDEIANIEAILVTKDQLLTLFQNLLLGMFILGANIGADIVSDIWGYNISAYFGGSVTDDIIDL